MKTITAALLFSSILLIVACNKSGNPTYSTGSNTSIVGKWNIDTVTTYFYDSTGLRNNGGNIYPGLPNYYFKFNADYSWVESLGASIPDTATSGTYILTSDSTFILLNPLAIVPNTPCKILSLTDHLFIFSKNKATVFNGTDSGYIKYVFKLTR